MADWNRRLGALLAHMAEAFPRERAVRDARETVDALMASPATENLPREMFESSIAPHRERLLARDTAYFGKHMDDISFIKKLNLSHYWNDKRMPEETRAVLWDDIVAMLLSHGDDAAAAAAAAVVVPDGMPAGMPDMSQMISQAMSDPRFMNMAQGLAREMESGGEPNFGNLMQQVQSIMTDDTDAGAEPEK